MPASPSVPAQQHEEKKVGPIIATLIIVLILIIAALYLFASRIDQPATPMTAPSPPEISTELRRQPAAAPRGPARHQHLHRRDFPANDLNASTNGLDNQNF